LFLGVFLAVNVIEEVRPYRVLSLDGGGMRGLYTASVLNSLMKRFAGQDADAPLDIGKGFNLIVGTSTGGILACGLAAGIPVDQIMDLYRKHGNDIFKSPTPTNRLKMFCWAIKHALSPANPNENLKLALNSIFKTETIKQMYDRRGIGICLNAVNMATHGARVFKTPHNPEKHADNKRSLVDVCLATSAAPIIFPVATVPDPEDEDTFESFVDGGLWANNPVLIALVEALEMAAPDQPIEIVSLGTCPPPSGEALVGKDAQRGLAQWKVGIGALEVAMDAQASGHNFIARFLTDRLTSLGRKVTLLRLKQSAPSSEQADLLGLDNASEKACSTLVQLGSQDGKEIYGDACRTASQYTLLKSIFEQLPKLAITEK
jgi:predicted acylesterase/phospholipase RssA